MTQELGSALIETCISKLKIISGSITSSLMILNESSTSQICHLMSSELAWLARPRITLLSLRSAEKTNGDLMPHSMNCCRASCHYSTSPPELVSRFKTFRRDISEFYFRWVGKWINEISSCIFHADLFGSILFWTLRSRMRTNHESPTSCFFSTVDWVKILSKQTYFGHSPASSHSIIC